MRRQHMNRGDSTVLGCDPICSAAVRLLIVKQASRNTHTSRQTDRLLLPSYTILSSWASSRWFWVVLYTPTQEEEEVWLGRGGIGWFCGRWHTHNLLHTQNEDGGQGGTSLNLFLSLTFSLRVLQQWPKKEEEVKGLEGL